MSWAGWIFVWGALLMPQSKPAVDPESGFMKAGNWELVRDRCTICHSGAIVVRQKASRRTWKDILRWMEETQGMPALDLETETKIVDYLSEHYAPSGSYRRPPISPSLMPPNPYRPPQESW